MNILVKGNNWLGDAVMSLPTLAALRKMFPKSHVTVLTKPSLADLYRGAPSVDETMVQERGSLAHWTSTVKELRHRKFHTAIILPRSFSAAFLVFTARIPRRIGYPGEGRTAMLTDAPEPPAGRVHHAAYFHQLLSAFGTPPPLVAPRLELQKDAMDWAAPQMPGGPWAALNPGATYGAAKQWPAERFIDIGTRLARHGRVIVVGGPAEAELGERVARASGAINFAGKTGISQLAAALARCRLLVTNDTGPMHVAAAVGTPIVAVFGPTDRIVTPPFGELHSLVHHDLPCSPCFKRVCPTGHNNCMRKLSSEEVWAACTRWLS